jgi:hypothetical protein
MMNVVAGLIAGAFGVVGCVRRCATRDRERASDDGDALADSHLHGARHSASSAPTRAQIFAMRNTLKNKG